jgi:hypothetical protein
MRIATLVLALLAWTVASAGAGDVTSVGIVEFGIYTADVERTVQDVNGIKHNMVTNICHVATTRLIPARSGLHFGFRYRVDGLAPGHEIDLRKVARYPVEVLPPGATRPFSSYEYLRKARGGTLQFSGYSFDHAWEFLPGRWIFQIFDGNRLLAEQVFTVVDGAEVTVPSGARNGENCFQMSNREGETRWRSI